MLGFSTQQLRIEVGGGLGRLNNAVLRAHSLPEEPRLPRCYNGHGQMSRICAAHHVLS